jgi:hypothetical protein
MYFCNERISKLLWYKNSKIYVNIWKSNLIMSQDSPVSEVTESGLDDANLNGRGRFFHLSCRTGCETDGTSYVVGRGGR